MIVHLLIPSFWIAIEERRRPELRLQPAIIGGPAGAVSADASIPTNAVARRNASRRGSHSVVCAANALALEAGVALGIPLSEAYHLCPEAVVLVPDLPRYTMIWDDVLAILAAYTPLIETVGAGEAACDVSGCERLFGPPVDLARWIADEVERSTGLPAAMGVATNRLTAQLAARRAVRHGSSVLAVAPGEEQRFLAPLPITALPGLDPSTLLTFSVLGIKTIGHLARLPAPALERRFGQTGRLLAQYARGRDERPVQPPPPEPAVAVVRDTGDVDDAEEPLAAVRLLVRQMADELAAELQRRNLAGRLVTLALTSNVQRDAHRGARGEMGRVRLVPSDEADGVVDEKDVPSLPVPGGRIHSMLPRPSQSSDTGNGLLARRLGIEGAHSTDPSVTGPARALHDVSEAQEPHTLDPQHGNRTRQTRSILTRRPVNDARTLADLAERLLMELSAISYQPSAISHQLSAEQGRGELHMPVAPPSQNAERRTQDVTLRTQNPELRTAGVFNTPLQNLELDVRHFVPPEQMALPGLERSVPDREARRREGLRRQEEILAARFGETPFRHVAAVDPESVLGEDRFHWGQGRRPQ